MTSLSRQLARFALATGYDDLPAEVIHQAKRCLLDTTGAALAGSRHADSAQMIKAAVRHFVEPDEAVVIGSGMRRSAMTAALANGVMAHALELDDGSKHATYHPGASIVPTALALGEQLAGTGPQVLCAIAMGYEVSLRIGTAINPSHYLRGFHPTGTIGHFGTTTVAGRLLGLSEDQLVHALGLAGSLASGINQYEVDGSVVKHLHPGNAARNGILAALLARDGFTGPEQVIEGRLGFCHCFADEADPDSIAADLGDAWRFLSTYFKPYCSCRYVHYAIECTAKILAEHPLAPEEVAAVCVRTHRNAKQGSDIPEFLTPLHARTSIQHGIACLLVNRRAGLSEYTPEAISAPPIRALARKITIELDPELQKSYPDPRPMIVEITTVAGDTFSARVDYALGDPHNPMSDDQLRAKFADITRGILTPDHTAQVMELAMALERCDNIRHFTDRLAAVPDEAK